MTDLSNLGVSLTKHGASKVADVLIEYGSSEVLNHLDGDISGIKIDRTQASKNLSFYHDEDATHIWEEARQQGQEAVYQLVFISIIFSHHRLIEAMIQGQTSKLEGLILRGGILDKKAYTNFAYIIRSLGFKRKEHDDWIRYDLSPIVSNKELIPLVKELLKIKLRTAGWSEENALIQESIRLNFHKVFALSSPEFSGWLSGDTNFLTEIEQDPEEEPQATEMDFTPGYNERSGSTITVEIAGGTREVSRVHNLIQKKLYFYLANKYGEDKVGTEQNSGIGTLIDIVRVDENGDKVFYELKTAKTVRTAIRQALPQLLEYAYWPNHDQSNQLVIVTINDITEQANSYLTHLREKFGIPIYYAKFDMQNGELEEPNI